MQSIGGNTFDGKRDGGRVNFEILMQFSSYEEREEEKVLEWKNQTTTQF